MTTVLILEGDMPELVAAGDAWSTGFVRTFLTIAPQLDLRIASPYVGSTDRSVLEGVDAVVFTGSGVRWNTHADEVRPHVDLMEAAFSAGLPVWGSCNGMQLAAVVLGGAVGESAVGMEVGIAHDVSPTPQGKNHHMMSHRSKAFSAPTLHRDEVLKTPVGAVVVAHNEHSPVQAMVYEHDGVDFWGTQYHPELRARDIAAWIQSPGLFEHEQPMVADLEAADVDVAAAGRLGVDLADLEIGNRASELVNWIRHVEGG
jgi:GMP synthase (glutamine-hydrolysing)